jgi:hypothetical protein
VDSVVFIVCDLLEKYLAEAVCLIDRKGKHTELSRRIDSARTELRTEGDPHPLFKNPFVRREV